MKSFITVAALVFSLSAFADSDDLCHNGGSAIDITSAAKGSAVCADAGGTLVHSKGKTYCCASLTQFQNECTKKGGFNSTDATQCSKAPDSLVNVFNFPRGDNDCHGSKCGQGHDHDNAVNCCVKCRDGSFHNEIPANACKTEYVQGAGCCLKNGVATSASVSALRICPMNTNYNAAYTTSAACTGAGGIWKSTFCCK